MIRPSFGPMTGNIYLDKPWTKFYKDKIEVDFDPHNTLYMTFKNSIQGREEEIAMVQPKEGRVMTYGKLLSEVDKAAAGLSQMGIKKGSMVGMFFSNSMEEAVFLLAVNKLGATSKWIDYTKDPKSLFTSVTEAKLDALVLEDMLKPLEEVINPGKIPTVICGEKKEGALHQITYEELKEKGKGVTVEPQEFNEERPSVIISSSGTTGEPKPIVHSDLNVNYAARKMMHSNFSLDKDHIVMVTIPPHIGLGLITSLYTNLISGAKLAMIHCNGPEDSMQQTVGFLINYQDIVKNLYQNPDLRLVIFGAPIHVRIISSVKELKDLSFLDGFLAAGSKISEEELKEFDRIYAEKGCKCPISNGYGQNEMAGAVCLNDEIHNVNGSAGYPVIGSNVLVVDEEKGELLPPNVEGDILEKCNTQFQYYYNMPEATQNSEVDFNDGRYFATKDVGYLSEDGFLHITGRKARVLVRFDTKISLDKLEAKVRALPFVKDCAAVAYDVGGSFEKLALYVEPQGNALDLTSESFNALVSDLNLFSDLEVPDVVEIRPIPYMANSKVDYQALKKTNNMVRTRK